MSEGFLAKDRTFFHFYWNPFLCFQEDDDNDANDDYDNGDDDDDDTNDDNDNDSFSMILSQLFMQPWDIVTDLSILMIYLIKSETMRYPI